MEGNCNVRKWQAINNNLQEFIINRQEQSKSSDEKVLGIHWNENADVFVINLNDYIKETEKLAPTKCNVLKIIAGFYDPIGFIQPIIVILKILFQEICPANVSWDDKLNKILTSKWLESINIMSQVKEIIVPRCYHFNPLEDPIVTIQLHGFSSSSILAYGGYIYLKFVTSTAKIFDLTVPRLELLENFVLSKLMVNVLSALKNDIVINSMYCYTDSQISLSWIRSINKEFKTFVQNRVLSIIKNVDYSNWRYCKTKENPADIITRANKNFDGNLRWNGPSFLGDVNSFYSYATTFMRIPFSKKKLKRMGRQTRVPTLC